MQYVPIILCMYVYVKVLHSSFLFLLCFSSSIIRNHCNLILQRGCTQVSVLWRALKHDDLISSPCMCRCSYPADYLNLNLSLLSLGEKYNKNRVGLAVTAQVINMFVCEGLDRVRQCSRGIRS